MSELTYTMKFTLGDSLEVFYVKSNYNERQISNIYKEACDKLGFNYVEEAASDDRFLEAKYVKKLIEYEIIDKDHVLITKEEDNHWYFGETGDIYFEEPIDFIELFFLIIKRFKPDFKWELTEPVDEILWILDGAGNGLY